VACTELNLPILFVPAFLANGVTQMATEPATSVNAEGVMKFAANWSRPIVAGYAEAFATAACHDAA
jgi:hypothetical protein